MRRVLDFAIGLLFDAIEFAAIATFICMIAVVAIGLKG